MIPIKEAISSGAWLHCEYKISSDDELTQFRIKILSYKKLDFSQVDNPERINFKDEGTIIWIMDLEVINLTKEAISPIYGPGSIVLVDQDGFKFEYFNDDHLQLYSRFAIESKLMRFFAQKLIPKIKATGAILFQLPDDDDEAVYSISLKGEGSIREA